MTDQTKTDDAAPAVLSHMPYVFRWNRLGRKGQPCNVTARGKMNSCRVEFVDGFKIITSRNAIRKYVDRPDDATTKDSA